MWTVWVNIHSLPASVSSAGIGPPTLPSLHWFPLNSHLFDNSL